MNYKINLNLASIKLVNAQKKHVDYFASQFFKINNDNHLLNITIKFKRIRLPKKALLLEDDFQFDYKNNSYILDTQKNALKVNFEKLSIENLFLEVDPDFDLYYLYSFFIEPILIIFGVEKGVLFVHSSAVEKNGKSILYPAWRHTGKTHLVLSKTINEGYDFMGDDFTFLYKNNLYLYPKKINLFSYNLKGFPKLYKHLSFKLKIKLKIMTWFKDFLENCSYKLSGPIAKVLFRVSQLAEVATNFKTNPQDIKIKIKENCKLDEVILLQSANYEKEVYKLKKIDIANKLTDTIVFELNDFINLYKKSCYISGKELNITINSFAKNYKAKTKLSIMSCVYKHIVPTKYE